jgi:hypothetical protein
MAAFSRGRTLLAIPWRSSNRTMVGMPIGASAAMADSNRRLSSGLRLVITAMTAFVARQIIYRTARHWQAASAAARAGPRAGSRCRRAVDLGEDRVDIFNVGPRSAPTPRHAPAWGTASGHTPADVDGPIFRQVRRPAACWSAVVAERRLDRQGLCQTPRARSRAFSGHDLRAGFLTSAAGQIRASIPPDFH